MMLLSTAEEKALHSVFTSRNVDADRAVLSKLIAKLMSRYAARAHMDDEASGRSRPSR